MRLGQLARKLEVNPGRLMEVLKELSIESDKGLNTQLDDSAVEKIEIKLKEKEKAPVEVPKPEPEISPEVLPIEKKQEEDEVPESGSSVKPESVPAPEPENKPDVELIKAPKIQLPGLKVLGKIELPEPVQKEEKTEDKEPNSPKTDRPRQRNDNWKKIREQGPKKSYSESDSYLERVKREEKAHRREKEIQELELKKKKKDYYQEKVLSKIKPSPPSRPEKRIEKPQPINIIEEKRTKPPSSLVGKIWRWLNT